MCTSRHGINVSVCVSVSYFYCVRWKEDKERRTSEGLCTYFVSHKSQEGSQKCPPSCVGQLAVARVCGVYGHGVVLLCVGLS